MVRRVPGTAKHGGGLRHRSIGRGFAYGALISFVVLFVAHIVAYARLKRGSRDEGVRFFSAPLLVPSLFLLVAGLVSVLLNVLLSGGSSYGLLSNLRVVAVILLILSLVVIYPLVFGTANESRSLQSMLHFYSRPVYWAIAAILIVSVFASILLPRETSLSRLWKEDPKGEVFEANVVNTQSNAEPLQWTLQGGFLSSSGGTWYVLTEADRLQAIPDDSSTRVVGDDFSIRYLEVGGDGTPVGEPVPQEDMKSWETYVAVRHCSGFPSQPTITNLGNIMVHESNSSAR